MLPTGDIDRHFVAMMIPHHQDGIVTALAVLRYGNNGQIRRPAQEIIVTEQQEIAAMRIAVGDCLPPAKPSPTLIGPTRLVNLSGSSAHSRGQSYRQRR